MERSASCMGEFAEFGLARRVLFHTGRTPFGRRRSLLDAARGRRGSVGSFSARRCTSSQRTANSKAPSSLRSSCYLLIAHIKPKDDKQASTARSTGPAVPRTIRLCPCEFRRSSHRPPEPKVPRSNRGGDTSDGTGVTPGAANCKGLRRLAFRAATLAHFATYLGPGSRSPARFRPCFRCRLVQTDATPGTQ